MNPARHPDLLDRLAASYALGTLRHGARRRFEALARQHASIYAAAQTWQARLSGLTELQPDVAPDPSVWTKIDNLVRADFERRSMRSAREAPAAAPPTTPGFGWRRLLLWRVVALGSVLAAVFAIQNGSQMRDQYRARVAALEQQLQSTPAITYVAVLAGDKGQPSMLVTFDARNQRLVVKREGDVSTAADKSLQLWALPPGGPPQSLGVLDRDAVQRLPATESEVNAVPALAVSLEPLGGVPSARGPTGPVLFKGALLKTVL